MSQVSVVPIQNPHLFGLILNVTCQSKFKLSIIVSKDNDSGEISCKEKTNSVLTFKDKAQTALFKAPVRTAL